MEDHLKPESFPDPKSGKNQKIIELTSEMEISRKKGGKIVDLNDPLNSSEAKSKPDGRPDSTENESKTDSNSYPFQTPFTTDDESRESFSSTSPFDNKETDLRAPGTQEPDNDIIDMVQIVETSSEVHKNQHKVSPKADDDDDEIITLVDVLDKSKETDRIKGNVQDDINEQKPIVLDKVISTPIAADEPDQTVLSSEDQQVLKLNDVLSSPRSQTLPELEKSYSSIDETGIDALHKINGQQLIAAIEHVIRTRYSADLDKIIREAVDKAVHREIERIKHTFSNKK
ncbi:MAG: hypothetical protein GY874_16370 [Desulfobacteraceae bacterium]|nr:hypothetical protein [Desulfobacteraceae bacterium]